MGKAFSYVRGSLKERFDAKVARASNGDCWEWQASLDSSGYGNFGVPREDGTGRFIMQRAHRVAFVMANGALEPHVVVRHSCDNRKCCNPSHLLAGTQSENMQDAVDRGRLDRTGAMNGRAKLRPTDVVAIRKSTDSLKVLAERYGVAKSTVAAARSGQSWT